MRNGFLQETYWKYNTEGGGVYANFSDANYVKSGDYVRLTEEQNFTMYIIPKTGYKIKSVKRGNEDVTSQVKDNTYKLSSVTSDLTFNVVFEKETPKTYAIKVTYNDGGTVKIGSTTINNGSSTTVNANANVQITITPNTGYHLKRVLVGTADKTKGVNNGILTISSISKDQEIEVTFEKDAPKTYVIKVTHNEGGTVKIGSTTINNGSSTTVNANANIQITITPNTGYHLKKVLVGTVDKTKDVNNGILTIPSVSKDQEIEVTFEKDAPKTYTIKVTHNDGGTIKVEGTSINNGSSATVNANTDVQINIEPKVGYHLKQVKINGEVAEVTNGVLTIHSISKDYEIEATFEKDAPKTYVVNVTHNNGGTIKVEGTSINNGSSATVNANSDVQINIESKAGYHLKQVKINGEVTDVTNGALIIPSISKDYEIEITFEKDAVKTYTVSVSRNAGGTIKINNETVSDKPITVTEDANVQIVVTPNEGYHLKQLKVGNEDVTEKVQNGTYTISSISANTNISVQFEQNAPTSYDVKVTYTEGGTVKINQIDIQSGESYTAEAKSNVVLTFTPKAGYYVSKLQVGSKMITDIYNNTYTLPSIVENLEVIVTFAEKPKEYCTLKVSIGNDGGYVKVNGQKAEGSIQIEKGKPAYITFVPDERYELKEAKIRTSNQNKDITGQITNNNYEIASVSENIDLSVQFQLQKYTLTLTNNAGIEEVIAGDLYWTEDDDNSAKLDALTYTVSVLASSNYLITQISVDGVNVYKNDAGTSKYSFSLDLNKDKNITFICKVKDDLEIRLDVQKAGTLSTLLSEEERKKITSLELHGEIDQRDLAVINAMPILTKLRLQATIKAYDSYPENTIPDKMFYQNKSIQEIQLSQDLKTIGKQAFYESNVSTVISENVTSIGEEAFKNCKFLQGIDLKGVSVVEKGTFENCENLTGVMDTHNVKEVKASAFRNCKNLDASIQFAFVEKMGDYAFENVKEINLYPAIVEIGTDALKGIQSTKLTMDVCTKLTKMPSLEGCSQLEILYFPPNVKEVSYEQFKGCTNLKEVYIFSGLEVIHDNTFKDCSKLEELTFPASLQKIGQNAFANSAGIREISAKIDDVPTAYENSFHANAYATATVTVPSNSLPFYEEDEAWGKFVNLKGSGIAERRTFSGEIIGNGCLYINGKKFYSFSTTRYFDYASRLEIVFSPDLNYKIKSIILDGEDITDELDQDNKYVIAHILENIQMEVTFVSKDNITSSESIQNEQGEIYASASGKLAFKGFAIGTPVYVYDITGKLVTMFEIQGDDVWDISYKGIVIVRIGKDRAIKLRL